MENTIILLIIILIILLCIAHYKLSKQKKSKIRHVLIRSFGDDLIVNTPVKSILKHELYM